MVESHSFRSRKGSVIAYRPEGAQPSGLSGSTGPLEQNRPRHRRPQVVTVRSISAAACLGEPLQPQPAPRAGEKLAGSREQAFRFLRSVIAQKSQSPKLDELHSNPGVRRSSEPNTNNNNNNNNNNIGEERDMPTADLLRHGPRGHGSVSSPLARPALDPSSRTASFASKHSIQSASSSTAGAFAEDRPLVSGNGVSVNIHLAEPYLFLQGFDQHDTTTRNTVLLRGSLHLKVHKLAKLKAISLKFKGTSTTRWPEGIPPKKLDFEETDTIMSHTWPFFNAHFPNAEKGSCADHVSLAREPQHGTPYLASSPANSSLNLNPRDQKRLSLGVVQTKSFDKSDTKSVASVAQRGYRTFYPGDYIYNFELPLDSRLPETIDAELGFVKYELEACVERAGAFRANLLGTKEITLIRAPTEGSLEQVEPIAISRTWEDQLHYDIVISGKSFPLGSKIPIAFKLTPLAKVQCHRVKVFIAENIEYFCSNKRVHRMEPTRKVLLYEKRADGTTTTAFPGSSSRVTSGGGIPYNQREAAARGEEVTPQDASNLLGHLEADSNIGPTEMEFMVQLPSCHQYTEKDRIHSLHFDTTYQNIQIHHWIKIVLRLSRPDETDPSKRRHFEISIDSPFHILSCRAHQANISLPAYTTPNHGPDPSQSLPDCGCPGAPRHRVSPNSVPTINSLNSSRATGDDSSSTNTPSNTQNNASAQTRPSLARPPTAHIGEHITNGHLQRPMHMVRAPSFNPPGFNDEEPPPPLVTPPPQYNDIASPTDGHGLADYFARWESTYSTDHDDSDPSDEDDRSSMRGRVNIPLTPGGRVNRSMDLGRRQWAHELSATNQ